MFRLAASPSIRPPQQMSVSEQQRKLKELLLGGGRPMPITGQYYDVIRASQQVRTSAPRALTNAAVRGINNKAGGVRSFAAANYNYPSGQMVIGASLAGFSASPSEDRKRQMARLMGLGASPNPELAGKIMLAIVAWKTAAKIGLVEFPKEFDLNGKTCNTEATLNAVVKQVSTTGLDLPASCDTLSDDVMGVQDAISDGDLALATVLVAKVVSCLNAVTKAGAELVGSCKAPQQPAASAPPPASEPPPASAPPVQPGPPRKLSQGEAAAFLNRGFNRSNLTVPRPPPRKLRFTPVKASTGNAGIIAAGVAAVGAAAYFLLRKKKSAA